LFLSQYSKRKSIVITAVEFGLFHLLSFLAGQEVVWVLGNVVLAAIIGLFYGYVVLKSNSLLPAMLVHWLGNTFLYAFTRYIQLNASITTNTIYGARYHHPWTSSNDTDDFMGQIRCRKVDLRIQTSLKAEPFRYACNSVNTMLRCILSLGIKS
jgi:hypothetical protein